MAATDRPDSTSFPTVGDLSPSDKNLVEESMDIDEDKPKQANLCDDDCVGGGGVTTNQPKDDPNLADRIASFLEKRRQSSQMEHSLKGSFQRFGDGGNRRRPVQARTDIFIPSRGELSCKQGIAEYIERSNNCFANVTTERPYESQYFRVPMQNVPNSNNTVRIFPDDEFEPLGDADPDDLEEEVENLNSEDEEEGMDTQDKDDETDWDPTPEAPVQPPPPPRKSGVSHPPEIVQSILNGCHHPPSAAPLTDEMIRQNNAAVVGPPKEIISRTPKTNLLREDLATLRTDISDGKLSNPVVDLYLEMLMAKHPNVYVFQSSFFSLLMGPDGVNTVREAAKGVVLSDFELLLFPVCYHGHWRLIVVDVKKRTIISYNSLRGSPDNATMNKLAKYLSTCPLPEWSWELKGEEDVPFQDNVIDCGVFTLQYARRVCMGLEPLFDFTQRHIGYFRERLMYECRTQELFPD